MNDASNVVALEGQRKPSVPEFITAKDIEAMSDDELDVLVSAIRTRRMNSYVIYKQTKAEKDSLEQSKAQARVEKKCEQILKTIDKSNVVLDKLEQQISELRGLRLQAGMALI